MVHCIKFEIGDVTVRSFLCSLAMCLKISMITLSLLCLPVNIFPASRHTVSSFNIALTRLASYFNWIIIICNCSLTVFITVCIRFVYITLYVQLAHKKWDVHTIHISRIGQLWKLVASIHCSEGWSCCEHLARLFCNDRGYSSVKNCPIALSTQSMYVSLYMHYLYILFCTLSCSGLHCYFQQKKGRDIGIRDKEISYQY